MSQRTATAPPTQTPASGPRTTLRVQLFPWIPDAAHDNFTKLASRVESEFESRHPEVDLVVLPMDPNLDLYDLKTVSELLANRADLVELDCVMLPEVVAADVIEPWPAGLSGHDWHPAGVAASTINDMLYGSPHWLCGHFVISHDRRIGDATDLNALVSAIQSASVERRIVGDFLGSWNTPAIYLDSWADSNGVALIASAISPQINPEIASNLSLLLKECETAGTNPCLTGAFHDNNQAAIEFAEGRAAALFGYSERLYTILAHRPQQGDLCIRSARLGRGSLPLLFTDSFVLRRGVSAEHRSAAAAFATYMADPMTYEWILTSADAGSTATPRYLIPARTSAFESCKVRVDPLYRMISSEIDGALPMPSANLYKTRKAMKAELYKALGVP